MSENLQVKITKEMLKTIADNSPKFSEQVKYELKLIIEQGNTMEEITKNTSAYFVIKTIF